MRKPRLIKAFFFCLFAIFISNTSVHAVTTSSSSIIIPEGYRIDSTISTDSLGRVYERKIMTYNEFSYLTSSVDFEYDTSNDTITSGGKGEFEWDEDGNKTLYAYYSWNSTDSAWVAKYKYEYQYDSIGNQNLNTYYSSWISTESTWVGYYKNEYQYDSDGNQTLRINYDWSTTDSTWIAEYKNEYQYDSNGNKTLYATYSWNSTDSIWVNGSKDEYQYDSIGNLTSHEYIYWNSTDSAWIADYKSENQYDSDGNKTLTINYDWNSTDSTWIADYKFENQYDSDGNKTLKINYDWSSTDSTWIADYKYEYQYDSNGNQTLYATYSWNSTDSTWVGSYKKEYEYTDNYYIYKYYKYDETKGEFVLYSSQKLFIAKPTAYFSTESVQIASSAMTKSEAITANTSWSLKSSADWLTLDTSKGTGTSTISYSVTENTADTSRIATITASIISQKGNSIYYLKSTNSNNLLDTIATDTIYVIQEKSATAKVISTQKTNISLYPNPVNDYFTVNGLTTESAEMKVYDLNGHTISKQTIYNGQEVNATELTKGIYLLYVKDENGNEALLKMVKE